MIKSKKLSKFKSIKHGFFNKLGGKSTGIYKSLNCGSGSLDDKKNIFKNLETVESKIKTNSHKIIFLELNLIFLRTVIRFLNILFFWSEDLRLKFKLL